jgi:hypothetical protein
MGDGAPAIFFSDEWRSGAKNFALEGEPTLPT